MVMVVRSTGGWRLDGHRELTLRCVVGVPGAASWIELAVVFRVLERGARLSIATLMRILPDVGWCVIRLGTGAVVGGATVISFEPAELAEATGAAAGTAAGTAAGVVAGIVAGIVAGVIVRAVV